MLYLLLRSYASSFRLADRHSICGIHCWRSLLALQILVCLVCGYTIGMLLALHLVLRKRGITTYEFITMQRELRYLQEVHQTLEHIDSAEMAESIPCGMLCKAERHRIRPVGTDASSIPPKGTRRGSHVPSFYPWLAWKIQDLLEKERSRTTQLHSSFALKSRRLKKMKSIRGNKAIPAVPAKETVTDVDITPAIEDLPMNEELDSHPSPPNALQCR